MSTHVAGRHHVGTYAYTPRHARQEGQPKWWRTERAHTFAAEVGDALDDLYELIAVAIAAFLVLCLAGLTALAVWPLSPQVASGLGVSVVLAAGFTVWHLRRSCPARPDSGATEVIPTVVLPVVEPTAADVAFLPWSQR